MKNQARWTTSLLAAAALLAGCSGAGTAPDPVTGGTGPANSALPQPAAPPAEVSATAPSGGAAVRLGDTEAVVESVGCTQAGDGWAMSGSTEGGAKVAVTLSADKQTVVSASVVFNDGKLVDLQGGKGSATIVWNGDSFTVSGTGTYFDLAKDPNAEGEQTPFVIESTCVF